MRKGLLLVSLSLAGCYRASSTAWDFGGTTGASETGSSGVDDATASSAGSAGEVGSSGGDGGPGSHEQPPPLPDPPPLIERVELAPAEIHVNGSIAVHVDTSASEVVRMKLASGDVVELAVDPNLPDRFVGAIPAFSGLDNGEHEVELSPWRGESAGSTVLAEYSIDLPTPGSEGFWESGDLIGSGFVAALAVLPDGDVVELGMRHEGDVSRCFLRRRDTGGAWAADDVIAVEPDVECTARDLAVGEGGELYVLVDRVINGASRWWLAKYPAWGAPPSILRTGGIGEVGMALAVGAESIAVCGSSPSGQGDLDAMAWIVRPKLPGETRHFDYTGSEEPLEPHWISETTTDCLFAGERLVLSGEAYGIHHPSKDEPKRDRLFVVEFDTASKATRWHVPSVGPGTQSGATAIALMPDGRYAVAGYACGDECVPEGLVRVIDPTDGWVVWQSSLGVLPSKGYLPWDIAWSPAGYLVVAGGAHVGAETSFIVRAYRPPMQAAPLWTYERVDPKLVQVAAALALGESGEVYAAGFGEGGFPAIAYIGG